MNQQIAFSAVRHWLAWLALTAAIAILAVQMQRLTPAFAEATDDFVQYWTAARLLLTGDNPYDPAAMLPIQQEAGRPRDYALLMYNPPWALTAVLWTGLFNYPTARALWFLLSLTSIIISADLLWRLYGNSAQRRWLAWALGLTSMPTLLALDMGQIGPLVLLGLTGFLYFSQQKRWFMAGACLALATIKPQLLYLFWVALLFWIIHERRWSFVLGGAVVGILAIALPILLNPTLISDYIHLTAAYPPFAIWAPPTWGSALRLWFGVEKSWLQWTPAVIGLLWLLFYWRQRRGNWCWDETLPPILLVALATGVYGWVHDQIVLIVVLMQTAVWGLRRWEDRQENKAGWRLTAVILLYLLCNGLILWVQVTETGGIIEVWTTLAWPSLYLLARGLNAQSLR